MTINGSTVKLVIWDLDDTFWEGTLADEPGAVKPREQMISILTTLTSRGIVNSICSKNEREKAVAVLQDMGVFDLFVFPSINWEPKGRRVADMVKQMQLRPANVLFVDDNHSNRSEVLYYNPDMQVMHPDDWHSCSVLSWGKDDQNHTRLQQYKLLEARQSAAATYSSNEDFLRDSNIEIKITSVNSESPLLKRLHELANRAWQLNYTRRQLLRFTEDFVTSVERCMAFAVAVTDTYGDHGIVGYICVSDGGELLDFLFSCRIMGMRVEETCLEWLFKNDIASSVQPEGIQRLRDECRDVSFIKVARVHNLDTDIAVPVSSTLPAVLLAGSCIMDSLSPFLESRFSVTLHTNEAPFHCVKDVVLDPDTEWLALVSERFGLIDSHYMQFCRALDADFSTVVLNFNWDLCFPAYRLQNKYVPLMMVDRLSHPCCNGVNLVWTNRQRSDAKHSKHRGRNPYMVDLEFVRSLDLTVLSSHIRDFRARLPAHVRLVLLTTTPVSSSSLYAPLYNEWVPDLSLILKSLTDSLPNVKVLDLSTFDGVADGDGMHYSREVLHQISEQLMDLISKK